MSKDKKTKDISQAKVALVHDYLREYGGAERVVEALHEIFPQAPLYVSFVDSSVTGIHWAKFQDWDIRQSWLIKIPFYKKLFSPLRIFAPQYFSAFDLSDYDLVISSTNAYFSKAVTTKKTTGATTTETDIKATHTGKKVGALHLSYCHTPARSLYGYTTRTDWRSNPITGFFGTILNHYLRVLDVKIARENVDYFIANSKETQRRIQKFYKLNSTVIYPPIEIDSDRKFENKAQLPKKDGYFLVVGRIAASKHVDLAVLAAKEISFKLKVVGSGRGIEMLQDLAGESLGKNIEFLGGVSDEELYSLYENASALLYPAEDEDFGMVPIEAMGHGIPVVAHKSGGPLETVQEGENGYFFDEFTVESFGKAIQKIQTTKWNRQKIYEYAVDFSKEKFKTRVLQFIKELL